MVHFRFQWCLFSFRNERYLCCLSTVVVFYFIRDDFHPSFWTFSFPFSHAVACWTAVPCTLVLERWLWLLYVPVSVYACMHVWLMPVLEFIVDTNKILFCVWI